MSTKSEWDVIVVGGGHNGLVAAAYLAKTGRKVLLLERREVVGGLCTTEELFPGFRGNKVANSPHNVDPIVLLELDLPRYGLRFIHPDPSAVMAFADGRAYVSYADPQKRLDELGKFSVADVEGFPRLNDYVSGLAKTLGASYYEPPPSFATLASRVKTPKEEEAFARIFFGSVADLVDDFLKSEELKVSVTVMALLTNSVGPKTPGSALPLMLRALHHESTVTAKLSEELRNRVKRLGPNRWVPYGGMGAVTTAMRDAAVAAGATIRTEADVEQVLVRNGRTEGVVLASGEEIRAAVVLANVDPKVAFLQLVPETELEASFRKSIERNRSVGDSAKVYLKLDGLPRFACARTDEENVAFTKCNFRVAPDMAGLELAFRDAQDGRIPPHPKMMGQIPSALDDSLCPTGKHLMSLSVGYIPHRLDGDRSWDTDASLLGERTVECLRTYISNLDEVLLEVRVLTPLDLERDYALPGGQASHGAVLPGSYFGFRPVPGWSDYRTPIVGMYLCGTGTWPGNFVSGLSGRNASRAILHDLGNWKDSARAIERRRELASTRDEVAAVAPV